MNDDKLRNFIEDVIENMKEQQNKRGMLVCIHPSLINHKDILEIKDSYPEHTVVVIPHLQENQCMLIPKKNKTYIQYKTHDVQVFQSEGNPMECYLVKKEI